MKKLLICLAFLITNVIAFAGVKKRYVGTNGIWNSASNWNPVGIPSFKIGVVAGDTIFFNSSTPVIITDLPNGNTYDFLEIGAIANVTFTSTANATIFFERGIVLSPSSIFKINSATSLFKVDVIISGNSSPSFLGVGSTMQILGNGTGPNSSSFQPYTSTIGGNVTNISVNAKVIIEGKDAKILNSDSNNLKFTNIGTSLEIRRDGGNVPGAFYSQFCTIKVLGVVNNPTTFSSNSIYEGPIEWNCPNQLSTLLGGPAILSPTPSFKSKATYKIINTGNLNNGFVRVATNPNGYQFTKLDVQGGTVELGSPTSSTGNGTIGSINLSLGKIIGNAKEAGEIIAATNIINVLGDYTQTGGVFDMSNRTLVGGNTIMRISGNLSSNNDIYETSTANNSDTIALNSINSDQAISCSKILNRIVLKLEGTSNKELFADLKLPDYLIFTDEANLGLNDKILTVNSGNKILGGKYNRKIVTDPINGIKGGMVQINNVGTTEEYLPIGPYYGFSFNPIKISNGGNLNYKFLVQYVEPSNLFNPNYSSKKIWKILPSANPTTNVNIKLQFSNADGAVNFNAFDPVDVGLFLKNPLPSWTVIASNLTPTLIPVPAPFTDLGEASFTIQASQFISNDTTLLTVSNRNGILSKTPLIQFNALKNNSNIAVNFKLSSSHKIENAIIQTTNNLTNFKDFANLVCKSTIENYESVINNTDNFIRLKLKEINGNMFYSNIINLNTLRNNNIKVYPTVTNSNVFIHFSSHLNEKVSFKVYNQNGLLVKSISKQFVQAGEVIPINFDNIQKGAYYIQIVTLKNVEFVEKIIKN